MPDFDTSASLLGRLLRRPDDQASWNQLVGLYEPLLYGWLRRYLRHEEDARDLTQEVLGVLAKELPAFRYDQGRGRFRAWLRTIMMNRLHDFWRQRKELPLTGDPDAAAFLAQLADPSSGLSQRWDREHDEHVARRLLELIRPQFEPTTWQAFYRVQMQGEAPAQVAVDLGLRVNAVYLAKFRVLRRLRQEMDGLTEAPS
jgi:RNA polymerase sigma-70 factor (ECF subfamily)